MHRRPSDDNGDERNIREMLRVLLKKLDKAADTDVTGLEKPRAYNDSQIQHKDRNKNVRKIVVSGVCCSLMVVYLAYRISGSVAEWGGGMSDCCNAGPVVC